MSKHVKKYEILEIHNTNRSLNVIGFPFGFKLLSNYFLALEILRIG